MLNIVQPSIVYVAKPNFLPELLTELPNDVTVFGNLVLASAPQPNICFAMDVWYEPQVIEFASISAAATILRQAGKYWFLNPLENVRRSHLILEQLRKLPDLTRSFPLDNNHPLPLIGCFSLLDKNTLLYSAKRWKSWPLGQCEFIEDKQNPPNRAYLKLWEALTLLGRYPEANETAMDLGASPGGWTYVMQQFGTQVTAVDKAELAPHIARLPRVQFLKQSAFALEPQHLDKKVDWLLCDVACYPERLYPLVMKWIASGKIGQMIFTLKLQGETDFATLAKFQAIPDSRTLHLCNNKHEATFFYPSSAKLDL